MNTIKTIKNKVLTILTRVWAKVRNEPVLVRTFLALLASAGVVELTAVELDRIDAIVMAVIIITGAVSARRVVTPVPVEERQRLFRDRGGIQEGPAEDGNE